MSSSSSSSSRSLADPMLMEPVVEICEDEVAQIRYTLVRHHSSFN